jgi:propanol-preferring alcohol dehydrogenase
MRAMRMQSARGPLISAECHVPDPKADQLLVKIEACGVCRTDLHIVDGELPTPKLPRIPGHEIIGRVSALGSKIQNFQLGQRVGIPWLGYTCGSCNYCLKGNENLCDNAKFTGYDFDGGYAEYVVADARFCFSLPESLDPVQLAPLLCAGLIGWRTLKLSGDGKRIGLYGFGAAAHILCQVAVYQGREVYAFTRKGDTKGQEFARSVGATWAGASNEQPPHLLDSALIFAPAGELIPVALKMVRKGGTVISGGIHMSDIPEFPYELLWGERIIRSVANLTRADAEEFLPLAIKIPIKTTTQKFKLEDANKALDDLRSGALHGAGVLIL